jgi:hypothetical protein
LNVTSFGGDLEHQLRRDDIDAKRRHWIAPAEALARSEDHFEGLGVEAPDAPDVASTSEGHAEVDAPDGP